MENNNIQSPQSSQNLYTPAILIILFIYIGAVVLVVIVLTSKKDASNSPTPEPTATPALWLGESSETLPPVQKVPLNEPTPSGKVDLDPELKTESTSTPSVLKDKDVQFKIPNY